MARIADLAQTRSGHYEKLSRFTRNPFGVIFRTSPKAREVEECHDMMRTGVLRASSWRTSVGRIAAVAVTLGGLSALAVAPSTAVAATSPTTASVISSTANAKLGTILVAGKTVYTLKASTTTCTAKCLKAWPPVLLPHAVKTATAGTGVDASKLGTVAAAKGALQITYSGKRLYWFVKDKAPGQVHGNVKDKWGKWSTVVTVTSTSGSTTPTPTAATSAPTTAVPTTPGASPAETSPPDSAAPETSPPETAPPATSPPEPQATTPKPPSTTHAPSSGGTGF